MTLKLSSGKGGPGAATFRREKHVPLGGPDGGDGGRGGDVYFLCDNNSHTLMHYKGKRALGAKNGVPGQGRTKNGKKGEDLEIIVPEGTQVIDAKSGELLLDMVKEGDKRLFLKGGKGGLGNVHFKSSTNQRPDYAQKGLPGEEKLVRLELKLIADVGLVGFPNVGKSTLISTLSNARPQVANYEFTTLTPKLGIVDLQDYNSFVMADIPGIIEGASDGKGLGLEFLRHISRTKVLLFMLDPSRMQSLSEQFNTLLEELRKYGKEVSAKSFAIAISKADLNMVNEDALAELKACFNLSNDFTSQNLLIEGDFDKSKPLFIKEISCAAMINIKELKNDLFKLLKA